MTNIIAISSFYSIEAESKSNERHKLHLDMTTAVDWDVKNQFKQNINSIIMDIINVILNAN